MLAFQAVERDKGQLTERVEKLQQELESATGRSALVEKTLVRPAPSEHHVMMTASGEVVGDRIATFRDFVPATKVSGTSGSVLGSSGNAPNSAQRLRAFVSSWF